MGFTGNMREKITGSFSGASSLLSFLGGYNVCHNICLGLIALLAVIGVSVEGMPLEFLLPYAVPLWILAVALLGFTAFMYFREKCVSRHMLMANTGLIIAATPFKEIGPFQIGFWVLGFGIAAVAVYNYFSEKKIAKEKEEKECCHTQKQ